MSTAIAWHRGELALQRRAGVDPARSAAVLAFTRDFLTPQHRDFYPRLPFVVVGAVDETGAPWATLLEGRPGFLQVPDPHHLRIAATPVAGDPAGAGLRAGEAVGLLGIELETRRRNRINGRLEATDAGSLTVAVAQAFGNCPQYIHTRDLVHVETPAAAPAEELATLDDAARDAIRRAATCFVASYADEGGRHVDVSHRGGRPGFIAVDGDVLTLPDFAGNQFFNTLGNLFANPRAGLVFPDFASGDVLQVTGSTEIVFDGPELAAFEGAQRLWRVRVQRAVRRRGALHWRGAIRDESTEAELTGTWAEARRIMAATDPGWQRMEVHRVVDEAESIRSYHLWPVGGATPVEPVAGMHLVLRLPRDGQAPPVVRSYSLSRLPDADGYRISVKKAGAGSGALHAALRVGSVVEARGPQGDFIVDASSSRPVVLASAGIGITPMLAMAEQLIASDKAAGRVRAIHFLHGARDGAAMPFRAELAALRERSGGALEIVRLFSRPRAQDVAGVDFEARGRLDAAAIERLVGDDHDFYLCGPAAFMQSLHDGLRARGVADDRIHAEAFGPSSLRRSGVPSQAPSTTPVPVRFVKSRRTATWTPGAGSLLELAEANGLQPESGCRNGSCGTCRVGVSAEGAAIAGAGLVAYPGRIAPPGPAGSALICCAVPASGTAGLDLDL